MQPIPQYKIILLIAFGTQFVSRTNGEVSFLCNSFFPSSLRNCPLSGFGFIHKPSLFRCKSRRCRTKITNHQPGLSTIIPHRSLIDDASVYRALDETLLEDETSPLHNVNGIICREVQINLEEIGWVTILEATADSQEDLVNMALTLEGDEDNVLANKSIDAALNAGDPYGAVLWPAASATANYLLTKVAKEQIWGKDDKDNDDRQKIVINPQQSTNKSLLKGLTILELGAGTGLVSIAVAIGGASKIIATDYESVPLRLLDYAALNFNHLGLGDYEESHQIETILFDICAHEIPLPEADIVVAADIMYEPKTGRAMAHRTAEALKRGSRVIIGCSPGRPGRPAFHEELLKIIPGIDANFIDMLGTTCSGPRHELICGKGSTSVSEEPKMLSVALMDLDPKKCLP